MTSLTPTATQCDAHRKAFDEFVQQQMDFRGSNASFLSLERYTQILEVVSGWEAKSSQERKSQIYNNPKGSKRHLGFGERQRDKDGYVERHIGALYNKEMLVFEGRPPL